MAFLTIPNAARAAILSVVCYHLYKIFRFGHREKNLPPGPPTIPVLGNAHLLPWKDLHLKFKEWSDQYGAVFSIKIGESTVVVLNDPRAVHQLINKRGALFADRPEEEQWDLATNKEAFGIMHSDPIWRAIRKIVTQILSPKNLDGTWNNIQEAEINQMMLDLLDQPEDFRSSVQRVSASIASTILYGHRAPTWENFWASEVHYTTDLLVKALSPGSYLPATQFPILKYIPERWLASKKFAKMTYARNTATFAKARAIVEERRQNGDFRHSLIDSVLDGVVEPDVPLTYSQINNSLLGNVHQGASETSSNSTLTSILFLAKNPHVQRKAQIELDRVCGIDRMPRWSDFDALPYINCIVKEGLRIRPVLPNGLPHRATGDSWYDGMLIPKDATVIIPIWALNHTYYPEPSTYNPDRYINHRKSSSEYAVAAEFEHRDHYAFGSGRRFCVGIHLGERTLWRSVAQLLWAFNIEPAVDADGEPVPLNTDAYEGDFASAPMPFKVRIVPRSPKHAEIVQRAAADVQDHLKQWE
ncbi:cytochrome P450 oxidoreductase-like protein [Ophiobolus disseminans]|uniref:Cytochrome P450 oxidoreductase-like protein n=1 Tax=Ophiobolus disseminans TaxID=1469910 RepID=A0A6A7A2V1_9PLEO|nr:cytochrome P450 oxidoreductase-like protein [Ophiobolus disseminans]